MTRRRGGQRRKSRQTPLLIGGLVVLAAIAALALRNQQSGDGTGTPTPTQAPAAAQADGGATPTPTQLVVPTPAIPLPRSCPQDTVPQVDNPARYGFCTPPGWGAYNENNASETTLVIKARAGDSPIVQVTDFDRIQIIVALNTAPPGDSAPTACNGPPNDSIDGLATHHCTAPLNPNNNPYHAVRAEYWMIDLFQNKRFYMTALIGPDATPDDDTAISLITHNVKPPGSQS